MSSSRSNKIVWRPTPFWLHQSIPPVWRHHLLDRGSLTQRLIEASDNRFSVELLRQAMSLPTPDEALILGIGNRQRALVREVILWGRDNPWVFARSVMPLSTLTGRLRSLRKLDNRPLGALLFADPTMVRGGMEIAQIPGDMIPDSREDPHATLWGRRSVFFLDNKPLLVSEIFLSGFTP